MEIKGKLNEFGLNPGNAVVIGSGILNALKIRGSNDIDVVVTLEKYQSLALDSRFKKEIKPRARNTDKRPLGNYDRLDCAGRNLDF